MRVPVIVDTNVPIIANGHHGNPICVQQCVERLEGIVENGRVLIDIHFCILREYQRNLLGSRQLGVGDTFLKWLFVNQANVYFCTQVPITPIGGSCNDIEEFPVDPDLLKFDPSDRKFVAVALASGENPSILNCSDPGWRDFDDALLRNGVTVDQICPQLM